MTVGQVIGRMTVRCRGAAGDEAAGRARAERPKPAEPAEPGEPKEVVLPDGIRISPVARRVAEAEGIDVSNVKGTGPAGRIQKDDVLAAASGNGKAATAAAPPRTPR